MMVFSHLEKKKEAIYITFPLTTATSRLLVYL